MLHCMQLRQFKPCQPPPDVQITPQNWISDPEVSNKQDDLYARAWECDYERAIFDADYDNTAASDPRETALQSDLLPEEKWNTPGTSRKRSPEIFPSTDGLFDGTDTCHYTEPDVEMGLQQHHPIPTIPRSSKYDFRLNPKPSCIDDNSYWMPNTEPVKYQFITALTTEHIRTRSGIAVERATEIIRSTLLWKIPGNLLTFLSPSVPLTSKTGPLIFISVQYTGRVHINLQTCFFFFVYFDYALFLHWIARKQRRRNGAVRWRQSKNAELDLIELTSFPQKGQ